MKPPSGYAPRTDSSTRTQTRTILSASRSCIIPFSGTSGSSAIDQIRPLTVTRGEAKRSADGATRPASSLHQTSLRAGLTELQVPELPPRCTQSAMQRLCVGKVLLAGMSTRALGSSGWPSSRMRHAARCGRAGDRCTLGQSCNKILMWILIVDHLCQFRDHVSLHFVSDHGPQVTAVDSPRPGRLVFGLRLHWSASKPCRACCFR